MSGSANLTDLAIKLGSGERTAFVRTHFGISAFGVNAFIADEPGQLIGEHDELGERSGKHEELYFVSAGHAAFVVNGDEIDAPAGTFVFVRDPAAKRRADATEAGTTIVVVGGRPGEAFTPSQWERNAPILELFGRGEYDQAIEALERRRAETPDDASVLYNLACAKSLTGATGEVVEHLRRAIALDEQFRVAAEQDPDFDAMREDPEFASALAGQPDPGGASS